jgi:hypothetical protein
MLQSHPFALLLAPSGTAFTRGGQRSLVYWVACSAGECDGTDFRLHLCRIAASSYEYLDLVLAILLRKVRLAPQYLISLKASISVCMCIQQMHFSLWIDHFNSDRHIGKRRYKTASNDERFGS